MRSNYVVIEYWENTVGCFCGMFSRDNPNFKKERFLKACGMEEGTW